MRARWSKRCAASVHKKNKPRPGRVHILRRLLRNRGTSSAGFRALWAALALCCLGLAVPGLAAAATGSIEGTVLRASDSEPVESAYVCAFPVGGSENGGLCEYSETDGSYLIPGLAPGEYVVAFDPHVSATDEELAIQYWNQVPGYGEATPVTVVSGGALTGIDAKLKKGGRIIGQVKSTKTGLGIPEAEVCAYTPDERFDNCGETDAGGGYELKGIGPGSRTLEVIAAGYERQYYSAKVTLSEANPLLVSEGGISTANFSLAGESQIRGRVLWPDGARPLAGAVVCAIFAANGELVECEESDASGNYVLPLLAAGAYKVAFSPELSEFGYPTPEMGQFGAPDAWPTQFWNMKTTLASAEVINLPAELAVAKIDARLGIVLPIPSEPPATSSKTSPPPPVVTQPVKPKPLRCRKGKRKVKRHGKQVCVSVHHHRKHHHHRKGKQHRAIH
jgi:hypothetical protein